MIRPILRWWPQHWSRRTRRFSRDRGAIDRWCHRLRTTTLSVDRFPEQDISAPGGVHRQVNRLDPLVDRGKDAAGSNPSGDSTCTSSCISSLVFGRTRRAVGVILGRPGRVLSGPPRSIRSRETQAMDRLLARFALAVACNCFCAGHGYPFSRPWRSGMSGPSPREREPRNKSK
jgi:hypothetical protein